jgi:hypothetical protein
MQDTLKSSRRCGVERDGPEWHADVSTPVHFGGLDLDGKQMLTKAMHPQMDGACDVLLIYRR